jgi:hypothetical protein
MLLLIEFCRIDKETLAVARSFVGLGRPLIIYQPESQADKGRTGSAKSDFTAGTTIVDPPSPKKTSEELGEERRRVSWNAFWTPFITLASIVSSVGLLMFFAKTCQERVPYPLQQSPPAPLRNRTAMIRPAQSFGRIIQKPTASTENPLHAGERAKLERMTPAQ